MDGALVGNFQEAIPLLRIDIAKQLNGALEDFHFICSQDINGHDRILKIPGFSSCIHLQSHSCASR